MRQLPNGSLSEPFFADLVSRRLDVACNHRIYHPFGEERGWMPPPDVLTLNLMSYRHSELADQFIDQFVPKKAKAVADPGLWYLILTPEGRPPLIDLCCFNIYRVPLLTNMNRLPHILDLNGEGYGMLCQYIPGRDFDGRLRSRWVFVQRNLYEIGIQN